MGLSFRFRSGIPLRSVVAKTVPRLPGVYIIYLPDRMVKTDVCSEIEKILLGSLAIIQFL